MLHLPVPVGPRTRRLPARLVAVFAVLVAPRRSVSAVFAVAVFVVFAFAASSCSAGGSGGRLLLARDTTAGGDSSRVPTTDIWAVDPGEQPSKANRVASAVASPLTINTVNDDGTIARDVLATAWSGQALLSFQDARATSLATVNTPGGDPTTLAETSGQLQTNVLRRGVYIATDDKCLLARDGSRSGERLLGVGDADAADGAEKVGDGLCRVSEDERWVVSWPTDGGRLTIRDLRTGTVRRVSGTTTDAVVLGHGASVLAAERTPDGTRGVVIDATTGKVTGRTRTYRDLRTMPVTVDAGGFVALAAPTAGASGSGSGGGGSSSGAASGGGGSSGNGGVELLWIGTDAKVQVIDSGALMWPIRTDSTVTYVRFGDQSTASDSIRRWDSGSGRRTELLRGRVGAAAVGADGIVATRDTERGVELYRNDASGALERVAVLVADTSGGSTVDRVMTLDDTVYLQIDVGGTMALARVDLAGDGSDVPVRGWARATLDGVDTDGTALVTGLRNADDQRETIGVVTPSSDRYVQRSAADRTGFNLIHDGVIYVTDSSRDGALAVRSVRTQGKPRATTLYRGLQLAGATWPTDNGATLSTLISRVALLRQQQSAGGTTGSGGSSGSGDKSGSGTP